MRLKSMAFQNPETINPLIILLANSTIMALITNKNSPRLKTVTGKVNSIKSGFKKEFKNAKVKATRIAVK